MAAAALAVAPAALGGVAAAGDCGGCSLKYDGPPRPEDEVWLVSTRSLGCPAEGGAALPAARAERYVNGEWQPADAADLTKAPAGDAPTCYYIHGNWVTERAALDESWAFYHKLAAEAGPLPLRYVIWSWPSAKGCGIVRDIRAKADRTDVESYFLAQMLSATDPAARVSLVGYSFGARIATGALHLQGGGEIAGWTLPSPAEPRRQGARVVLLAAAMHSWWLEPGQYHGMAPGQIDRALVLYNSCDYVLKRYRFVSRCSRPSALGYTGIPSVKRLGEAGERFAERDACCSIGKSHHWSGYLCSPRLADDLERYALWQPVE
jgi:hypothetical protein